MVQCSERWEEVPDRYGLMSVVATPSDEDVVASRAELVDELVEDGRLELLHVRRLLEELTVSRFGSELDSWSQRRYDALCRLEQELLRFQV